MVVDQSLKDRGAVDLPTDTPLITGDDITNAASTVEADGGLD